MVFSFQDVLMFGMFILTFLSVILTIISMVVKRK